MIDMEKVIKGLETQLDDLQKYADVDETLTLTQEQAKEIIELLKEQPQIVRCKDCKYRMKNSCIIFQKYGGTKYDDWFCGDGVKKDA